MIRLHFVHWGKKSAGNVGTRRIIWMAIICDKNMANRNVGIHISCQLADRVGAHKQIGNRIIGPYCHMSTVMTATDLSNFYALRRHPDAQPEIRALADAMYVAQNSSTPVLLNEGEWHLPFITEEDRQQAKSAPAISIRAMEDDLKTKFAISDELIALIGVSVARCARTSYSCIMAQQPPMIKILHSIKGYWAPVPIHASPAEHIATPDPSNKFQNLHGNFSGYVQYRKMLPENANKLFFKILTFRLTIKNSDYLPWQSGFLR